MQCRSINVLRFSKELIIIIDTQNPATQNRNIKTDSKIDIRALLSTLWIVVLINMLKADILSLYIPNAAEELAAFAGDTPIPLIMLFGAILVETSTVMVILSRILPHHSNRWANITAVIIALIGIWGAGSSHPHYFFIAFVETFFLCIILWKAWCWQK